jgi:hypothetical protein
MSSLAHNIICHSLFSNKRHDARYFGKVVGVLDGDADDPTMYVDVRFFNDDAIDRLEYPIPDVEKLDTYEYMSYRHPNALHVGDVVDALFQDGKLDGVWFRGRVVSVDDDGGTCDVFYYDGDVSFR